MLKLLIRTYIIVIIIGLCTNNLLAQNKYDSTFSVVPKIEFYSYAGKLWLHRDAMKSMGNKPYWGNELRISMQTSGKKHWQEAFKYPAYGIGFYSGHFNNPIIGNPFATFVFMDFPVLRKNKFYISTNWGIGLSFNINEFDSVKNNKNMAIGTDLNVYIDFMLLCKYKLHERWEVYSGFKFQHFSNGSVKKPNLGLNMVSGTLGISYYPFKTIKNFKTGAEPEKYKKYEFTTMLAYGINGIESNNTKYNNATLSISANKRINFKRNFGIGVDVFYNEYIKTYMEENTEHVYNYKLMSYAFTLSSDMIVNKFRMTTQVGVYMHRSTDYSVPVYERVALRYYPIKNIFTNVSIKAHGFKAQFIEWGLGVTF